MKTVEKTLTKFNERVDKAVSSFKDLKIKKENLQNELDELNKKNQLEFNTQDLLNGNYKAMNNPRVTELKEEIEAINSFFEAINSQSVSSRLDQHSVVCRADKELEQVGGQLKEDTLNQVKEASKKQREYLKRMNKAIEEIESLKNEIKTFKNERDELLKIKQHLERLTVHTIDEPFYKIYNFEGEKVYEEFRKITKPPVYNQVF